MRERDFRGGNVQKIPSITFDVTTAEVQNFLQGKVTALMAAAKNPRPIKVGVSTFRASDPVRRVRGRGEATQIELFPFIITLPESVMIREKQDQQINEVFLTGNQTNKLHLINGIDTFLRSYQYTKEDMTYFNSPRGRHFHNLTSARVLEIKKFRFPTLIDVGGEGGRGVAQVLDPLKVFHDYFTDVNNPHERFYTNIIGVRRVNDSFFVYTIRRELLKNGNRKTVDDLNAHVRNQIEKMGKM